MSELLLSRGLVSRDRLEECARQRDSKGSGGSLVDVLIDSGEIERLDGERTAEEARALEATLEPDLPGAGKLGEFRLIREIGRGGMGIVFEAEQEPLGRRVALKILPAGAALDERLSIRFLKEARAAARLSHPGIVPVYSSGRAQGVLYFAMEMIEGRSLAEVAAEGPVDPARATRLSAEIARALDYAHREGLVHRDVKPENILLNAEDHALITDFGLVHEASAGSFTLSHHVLGTPAFISPEQALGRPVDARSDVYSLGAVLYTLLAGKPPYAGEVPSVVLGRVLAGGPPRIGSLRPGLPLALVTICERAMARAPSDRYGSALEMAQDLERCLLQSHPESRAGNPEVVEGSARLRGTGTGRGGALALAGLALFAALVAVSLVLLHRTRGTPAVSTPSPATSPHMSASFTLLPSPPGRKTSVALSPDGRLLAYTSDVGGNHDLFLQHLGQKDAINLTPNAPAEEEFPSFSPDGNRIAFSSAGGGVMGIHVLDLATREVTRLTSFGTSPSWSTDGREIVFAGSPSSFGPDFRLWAVEVATKKHRLLKSIYAVNPACSPHGNRIAFASQSGGQMDIWTLSYDGGEAIRVTDDPALDWNPVWSPDGTYLYFGSDRGGSFNLWRVRMDEDSGRTTGSPEPLSRTAFAAPFGLTASARRGTLALVSLEQNGRLHVLACAPGANAIQGVPRALPRRYAYTATPDLSPDGQSVAFTAVVSSEDIAVTSVANGAEPHLLTEDASRDGAPRWSPDGSTIAFQSDRAGGMAIWTMKVDGSGLRQITFSDAGTARRPVWSPDGRRIAYTVESRGAFVARIDGAVPTITPLPAYDGGPTRPSSGFRGAERSLHPHPDSPSSVFEPWSWSPDGRMLAGTSAGTSAGASAGTSDAIVLYSIEDGTYRRVAESGESPTWLGDSRHLLFMRGRELCRLDTSGTEAQVLFSAAPSGLSPGMGLSFEGRSLALCLTSSAEEIWGVQPPP